MNYLEKITIDKVEHDSGTVNRYKFVHWGSSGPAYKVRRNKETGNWDFVKYLEKSTGRIIFGW